MEQAIEQVRRRVAPVGLARERTLPMPEGLTDLLPEQGLVRGRFLACTGPAATSLALALVAPTVAAGSWLAVIDLPTLGPDAASEAGIALERVVAVSSTDSSTDWATTVASAADGFDVVLTRGAGQSRARSVIRPTAIHRVRARVQQRGAVVVVVGDPGALSCDGVFDTTDPSWEGLGEGDGRLCRRTVEVRATGRRIPTGRRCRIHLPATGGPALAAPGVTGTGVTACGASDPAPGTGDDPRARPELVLAG